jgi:hypothetical protein
MYLKPENGKTESNSSVLFQHMYLWRFIGQDDDLNNKKIDLTHNQYFAISNSDESFPRFI